MKGHVINPSLFFVEEYSTSYRIRMSRKRYSEKDIHLKNIFTSYGGIGYAHILNNVWP